MTVPAKISQSGPSFKSEQTAALSPAWIFDMVKLTVRFHKGLASYAYERLAKKRLDEERDCQRWIDKAGNPYCGDALICSVCP